MYLLKTYYVKGLKRGVIMFLDSWRRNHADTYKRSLLRASRYDDTRNHPFCIIRTVDFFDGRIADSRPLGSVPLYTSSTGEALQSSHPILGSGVYSSQARESAYASVSKSASCHTSNQTHIRRGRKDKMRLSREGGRRGPVSCETCITPLRYHRTCLHIVDTVIMGSRASVQA